MNKAVLLCVVLQVALAAAEYMYRPSHGPPHLMHGPPHGPPHGPHKHHPYSSGKAPGGGPGKHGPPRHPPPPHYHGRPHQRPRKPPPPPPLHASSHWKSSPYKTTKDPFRSHGSDPDFGNQAAVLSAIKSSGAPSIGSTSSSSSSNSFASSLAGSSLGSPLLLGSSPHGSSPLGNSLGSSHVSVVRPSLALPSTLHTYTNVISDDRGPIHTIPAPQLSPADKPSHLGESSSSSYRAALEQHALQRQAIQSALHQLTAAQAARPTTSAPIAVLHHTQGYQVSEPSTLSHAQDASAAQLFAPDPDPSRPAPKLRPTTDPHSLPSEGRGPHFSIDPQFGAVSSQPGSGYLSTGPTLSPQDLSPQDLFHLLNGFPLQGLQGLQPLQQDVHPHVQIMPQGLTGDSLTADHQHLLLQQHQQQQQQQHLQHLQQQHHLQQQLQAQAQMQAAHSLHQLRPAEFQPHYQSFNFDEQSYQKSLFQGQDHEVSEDAPRPSIQRPDPPIVQDPSPSASTVTLYTAAPPQSASISPPRGDIRSEDDATDDDAADEAVDDGEGEEDYENSPAAPSSEQRWPSSSSSSSSSSTTQAQVAVVTPAPQPAAAASTDQNDAEDLQVVIREEADTYATDPSLITPFRRQPNSVDVPEVKSGRLPYGARIRGSPKRVAVE